MEMATKTRVDATKSWLSVSLLRRRSNAISFSRPSCIRFRRRYESAIMVANASATISSAITVANNDADASADGNAAAAMVADRLHNQATPWLMLPSEVDKSSGDKVESFYSLADGQTVRLNRKKSLKVPDTAKCVASTRGSWLGYVDTKEGSFYLASPFLNQVVELPSLEHLPCVAGVERDPETGSILEFKVSYPDYDWYTWDNHDLGHLYHIDDPESMTRKISHLALSTDSPLDSSCVAMALQGEMSRLAYCHIGKRFNPHDYYYPAFNCSINNDPNKWYGLQEDYFPGMSVNQVVYSSKKGLFYAMFNETGILALDVESNRGRRSKKVSQFRMFELKRQLEEHFFKDGVEPESLKETRRHCYNSYYLVTLYNGDLLLIVRHYVYFGDDDADKTKTKTVHFDVFRVAYPGTLERVRSLEDRAIFIGHNQSFCIKASVSPGIRPNSIYFTVNPEDCGHDSGIFCMEDGVISPIGHPEKEVEEEEEEEPLYSWVAPVSYPLLRECDKERNLPRDVFCVEG